MDLKYLQTGFTLIELLVGVAIVSIIAAISIPSLEQYNKNSAINNRSQEFVRMLQFARTEAVQRNQWVNVETTSAQSDNYGDQLWVCFATSATQNCTQANLIKLFEMGSDFVSVRSSGSSGQVDDNISFNARGRLDEPAIQIAFCPTNGSTNKAKFMNISVTGRAFIQDFDAAQGHVCNPN